MVDLESPRRQWSVRLIGVMALCVSAAVAGPLVVSPRFQVKFPAAAGGKAAESIAVSVEGPLMVVVVAPGADPASPEMQSGNRPIPVEMVGHDPVSRLAFLKTLDGVPPKNVEWLKEAGANTEAALQFMDAGGPVKCRSTGWVKQVGGKILPLALLQVNFSGAVPPPGTALLDESGRIAGIVFQSTGNANTGYAIPAEAVHRVRRDICGGSGQLTRGWLGLALQAESRIPQVSRVLPGSPAAAAGILPNDVLTAVGSRRIADYADAANAFFYLLPGQLVKVKLLRDAQPLEYSLIPVSPK